LFCDYAARCAALNGDKQYNTLKRSGHQLIIGPALAKGGLAD
jgi:hypothetical protein